MKYSVSLTFKYFSIKMNRGKLIFHRKKEDFKPIRSSVHTAEYLAFGKPLLARMYLNLKVYITNILQYVNNLQKISCLK